MDHKAPAAALGLIAVAVVLGVTTRAHGSTPPDPLLRTATTPGQANGQAGVMLDRAYQIGAVRLTPPAGFISLPSRAFEVEQQRWMRMQGSPVDVLHAFVRHPPAGFVVTSKETLTRSTDEAYEGETVELKPYGSTNSSMHVLDVTVSPAANGHSVALLQATVGWVPPRTAAERMTADVRDAVLSVGLGTGGGFDRPVSLSPTKTQYLAFLLNQLPSTTEDRYDECPGPDLGMVIVDVPAMAAEYRVQLGGCHQVSVLVRGNAEPTLLGDDGFDLELTQLAGTTPNG